VASHDIDLFHTVAIVKIPPEIGFGFGNVDTDLRLVDDIDHLNFRELPAGTVLGWGRNGREPRLSVHDDNGMEVFDRYFSFDNQSLVTTRPFMPSMFTLDETIIRQDCLGYLMERLLPE
jgi:hypothetical protein